MRRDPESRVDLTTLSRTGMVPASPRFSVSDGDDRWSSRVDVSELRGLRANAPVRRILGEAVVDGDGGALIGRTDLFFCDSRDNVVIFAGRCRRRLVREGPVQAESRAHSPRRPRKKDHASTARIGEDGRRGRSKPPRCEKTNERQEAGRGHRLRRRRQRQRRERDPLRDPACGFDCGTTPRRTRCA